MRNSPSCYYYPMKSYWEKGRHLLTLGRGQTLQIQSAVTIGLQTRVKTIAGDDSRLFAWLTKVLSVTGLDIDQILSRMAVEEPGRRANILARELLNQQSEVLVEVLSRFRLFELPVPDAVFSAIFADIPEWQKHRQRAMTLGLLEVSQYKERTSYRPAQILAPLLPSLDSSGLAQRAVEKLYQLWWEQAEIVNEAQCLEMYRLARLAGNSKITLVMGTTLGSRGKTPESYREAIPLPLDVLKQGERRLGSEYLDVASSLDNLAFLYYSQGRYSEAEPLYITVLKKRKRRLGRAHPDVALSLNNLAGLYESQGRYGEAEPLYVEALEMRKQLLGDEHLDVASSLNNLAGLYESQGRYGEAEPLYVEALRMRKRLLGGAHPDVASSLNNLAGLYYDQGRYGEAEPLYVKALGMRKRLLGSDHPAVASSLNNLAMLYKLQGRYDEAERLYHTALSIMVKHLGGDHPYTLQAWQNFVTFVEEVSQQAQMASLSAHPVTQRLLNQMQADSKIVIAD